MKRKIFKIICIAVASLLSLAILVGAFMVAIITPKNETVSVSADTVESEPPVLSVNYEFGGLYTINIPFVDNTSVVIFSQSTTTFTFNLMIGNAFFTGLRFINASSSNKNLAVIDAIKSDGTTLRLWRAGSWASNGYKSWLLPYGNYSLDFIVSDYSSEFVNFLNTCAIPTLPMNDHKEFFDYAYSEGYDVGYQEGVDYGTNAGYQMGLNQGYQQGLSAGHETGYNEGYDVGYQDGDNAGYENGYSVGSTDGYERGYDEGYDLGYEDGVPVGYDTGYTSGYSDGHSDGLNLGHSDRITNPISSFIEPVHQFMNTQFFGSLTYATIFNIVLFVAVAVIFIKMFSGG